MRRALLLPLLFTVAACGGDAGGGEWAGTVDDSAGVAVVNNPAEGIWSAEENWTLEEDLRIGEIEGAPEYQFGQVVGLDVDSAGRIFVLDQQAQRVAVYGSGGDFSHYIGSPGNGPGELTPGTGGIMLVGGEVLVPDLGAQRVSVFSPDGEFRRSWRVPLESGIPIRWDVDATGRPLAQLRSTNPMDQSATEPIIAYGDSGQVADTLATLTKGQGFQITESGPRWRIFAPEPIWEVMHDGGVVTGMNDAFRIEMRGPEGSLERVVKLPREARPIDEGEQRRVTAMLRNLAESQGAPPQQVQMFLNNLSFAENYPKFASLLAGPHGTLWVQRVQPLPAVPEGQEPADDATDLSNLGAPEWDVFDPEGRYLGVARMPERFQPVRFVGDAVYGIWRDELDVQHVMRLRLGPSAPADA